MCREFFEKYFKKLLSLTGVLVLFFANISFAQSDRELLKQAETLYNQQQYEQALQIYLTLESKYASNWQLNYNIGNSYFHLAAFPNSVLYYERALRLNPNNRELQENIKTVNSRLRGEVYQLPEFFVWRWMKTAAGWLMPSVWLVVILVLLALTCIFFCCYYFTQNRKVLMFYTFLFFAILTTLSFSFAIVRSIPINEDDYAIVFDANGLINEDNGEQKFGKQNRIKLFNGEKVQVLERGEDFYIIKTPEGNRAKVETNSIQMI